MPIDSVLVAGASGGTGRELLHLLSGADLAVRGLTRSAEREPALRGLGADEVVVGDLMDRTDADRAVAGVDGVLCAVGADPGVGVFLGDPVDGTGVVNLVDAAAAAGVDRFVLQSAVGVGDSESGLPLLLRIPFRLTGLLAAKERAEVHLRGADLTHAVVRPGGLGTEPARGDAVVAEGGDTVSGSIPRADVARLLAAALVTPAAADRTFEAVSRRDLRGEATGVVDVDWALPPPLEWPALDR